MMPLAQPALAAADPTLAPVPPVILDVDAKPVLDWTVPSRWAGSWQAWDARAETYNSRFVNPRQWPITLDGCQSRSKWAITGYEFRLSQVGTAWTWSGTSKQCRTTVPNLPAQGSYRITLTLRTHGNVDGVSRPVTQPAKIRDYVIVSFGDSLASGEGNPDTPGRYKVDYNNRGQAVKATLRQKEVWKDRACHRSALSAHARAAKTFEDADPKTSVTFLSLGCSGAKIEHLHDWNQPTFGPKGSKVTHQVGRTAALVGRTGQRRIDALMITVGVNNLNFSSIVERCASNWHDIVNSDRCVRQGGIAKRLKAVPKAYDRLGRSLRTQLPNTRRVYINPYPANVFRGGGCGSLHLKAVGISKGEGAEMYRWGKKLNREIVAAAKRQGWATTADPTAAFANHAYCPRSKSWFRSYEESWTMQGDKYGTAHPNATGHRAIGTSFRQRIGRTPA